MKLLPIKTLEKTFNRYLSLDSDSPKLLAPLIGKVMGIHIQRPKIAIYFSFDENNVQLSTERPATVNTEIYTTLFQLMRLKLSKSTSLINAQFHIQGDVDTAQRFNELFEKHQIDWEEHLSKLIGDVTAHKMIQLLRKPTGFIKTNKEKFCQDVTEYCQEEAMLLPANNEVEIFRRDVDELRLQIDRLEARINGCKMKIATETLLPLAGEGPGRGMRD
ncbi:MAG: SCP2 sterol-binding domain-containing protein [Pseudomonadota bacterium]